MTNQLKTEIEKINQGCGEEISRNIDRVMIICGKGESFTKRKNKEGISWTIEYKLCPSCQAKKQCIILGAKMMIDTEFLEEIKKCVECEGCRRIIDKKIADLKQLNNWLEKE